MSNYEADITEDFKKDFKALQRKHDIVERLNKKVSEILENPHHYKLLRNVLRNRRRTHIGSYVLIFEVLEEDKMVVFHSFKHHDDAY